MDLPALLPEELQYTSVAESDKNLFNMVVKIPQDFFVFFDYACGDETWSEAHASFMRESIQWLTDQFFQDKLLMENAQSVVSSLREHDHVLRPYIPKNLTFSIDGTDIEINSLLWGGSSETLRQMIREGCRDKDTKKLELEGVSAEVFPHVEEFITTGNVKELWRKNQEEVLEVLRQAAEWGLIELRYLCEDILRRYITRGNVIDTLILAHEERWQIFKEACMEFVNGLDVGVRLETATPETLSLEFKNFQEDALKIFESLQHHLTHLVCGYTLTEQEPFSDVINRCPNLICLDISNSHSFSDRLVDIPETLEELNVSKCSWLTNKNFPKLTEICPNLSKISLASNSQINYSGWGVLRKWECLAKLDISRCRQIGDDDFKVILRACGNATHLTLEQCLGLTDNAFFELAQSISKLTDLDVSRCHISDGPLIDIATRCKQLTTLNCSRCSSLTETGIVQVVRNASNLRSLDITRCSVSPMGLAKIKQIRPYLKVMS
ncbi:MAG: hypothetical protein K940chlam7_02118 [Chlamydiae bacterium]|nr:hypothetical protein [Chlamydiota bacterium]